MIHKDRKDNKHCLENGLPSSSQTNMHCFLGYVTTIIEDAKIYATHAKKSTVDAEDIKLAIQCRMDQSFTSPPPRDVRNPNLTQPNPTLPYPTLT